MAQHGGEHNHIKFLIEILPWIIQEGSGMEPLNLRKDSIREETALNGRVTRIDH
jgi:hypothetical protein